MFVQYLGHSCFLLATAKARILIDPFLTGNPRAATTADKVSAD
ncbi:MAG: metal-dependent hydrolase, partial [Verrucomicrobia bacterium]|nr:metal-dependent hydrolase [Verrucomicrobiota bacterium]